MMKMAGLSLIAANFLNHPHFAHSYQIFYRGFTEKAFDNHHSLKNKYLFAGIGVPVILTTFFVYCMTSSNFKLLGFAGNAMSFLVGWHYVKQGYGMLMVSAVLKRNFFNDRDKQVLLFNAYFVWLFSWALTNNIIAEMTMWGIEYYVIALPEWFLWLLAVPLAVTTLWSCRIFISGCLANYKNYPINGVISYLTSLYIWLIVVNIHPVLILIIPAFHSLQYLVVVWRYEINRTSDVIVHEKGSDEIDQKTLVAKVGAIILLSVVFGFLGFWVLPVALEIFISYEKVSPSLKAFFFIFWIFINIHHYFIDNVIWKKENTDVSKYLFS